jgi:flagellar motor switch protein FliN
MNRSVETPSFTFRLERVRSLRERAEDAAREELARELSHRVRGEALLRQATSAVSAARDTGRDTVLKAGASGADLLAAQVFLERAETLALGPGSIITLNRLAGEPVDLLVNGKPIARGEVVVIDEEFGLRVTEVSTGVRRSLPR